MRFRYCSIILLTGCSGTGALPDLIEAGRELPSLENRAKHMVDLAIEACAMSVDDEQIGACQAQTRTVGDQVMNAIRTLTDAWCTLAPSSEGCADR